MLKIKRTKFKTGIREDNNRLFTISAETAERIGPALLNRMQAVQTFKAYKPTGKYTGYRQTTEYKLFTQQINGTYGD